MNRFDYYSFYFIYSKRECHIVGHFSTEIKIHINVVFAMQFHWCAQQSKWFEWHSNCEPAIKWVDEWLSCKYNNVIQMITFSIWFLFIKTPIEMPISFNQI